MRHKAIVVLGSGLATALAIAGCQHGLAHASSSSAEPAPTSAAPFATPPVLAGTPDVATLVARVRPAVVNITTTQELKGGPNVSFEGPFDLGPFSGLLPGMHMRPGTPGGPMGEGDEVMKQRALGSGFIIDTAGHVVTNAHVVDGADQVKVKLADDREFDAKVKGKDTRLDIAILELQGAKDLPVASLGSSQDMRIGDYVVAIGNPFGLGDTVTMGILSAKSRDLHAGPYDDFLQTDASINPGNSGGPLFNLRGQVIGINTAINPRGKGIGFAIPSDALRGVLTQLLTTGHVERGRLGVMIQPVDPTLAKALGLDKAKGALVGDVESTGPAAKVGMRAGDVVVSVDGEDVSHAQDLPRIVARHAPGATVRVGVVRDKAPMTFNVTLDALNDSGARASADGPSTEHTPGGLGLQLGDGPNGGARVEGVAPGGAAAESLSPGDVIVEVNRVQVSSARDAIRLIQAAPKGDPLLLKIRSANEGRTRYVAIERG
jgi:serine protease Do